MLRILLIVLALLMLRLLVLKLQVLMLVLLLMLVLILLMQSHNTMFISRINFEFVLRLTGRITEYNLTVSMSKHRFSLSMSNSPGVIGGSGDGQEWGVLLAVDLEKHNKEHVSDVIICHQKCFNF